MGGGGVGADLLDTGGMVANIRIKSTKKMRTNEYLLSLEPRFLISFKLAFIVADKSIR